MMGYTRESWTAWNSPSATETKLDTFNAKLGYEEDTSIGQVQKSSSAVDASNVDEKTPLLAYSAVHSHHDSRPPFTLLSIPRRIAEAIIGTFKLMLSAVLAPGRYLLACFYDEKGNFSASMPLYKIGHKLSLRRHPNPSHPAANGTGSATPQNLAPKRPRITLSDEKLLAAAAASSSAIETDSESSPPSSPIEDSPAQNTRSKAITGPSAEDQDAELKKGPRVKIVNQEELRRRKQKRSHGSSPLASSQEPPLTVATIKSPTSPSASLSSSHKLTKYPRLPAPPRPLVPRRQPSYTLTNLAPNPDQKTLVIDLDETLIHSMAKGGRMSTGHMVEVKLSSPVGLGGNVIGPQVPILYYVHKRPHCDEFLRKISKWYNLIVFTASVQEYADPVIDWLEQERKYFSARYYRQHCTYRNGAYIKDLSQVEPDLSRVMILDNSPMSYIFHEDNAIPIEGWISDPTDNDLLNLIPLFEGLQHATDVRALLALRLGEAIS